MELIAQQAMRLHGFKVLHEMAMISDLNFVMYVVIIN